MKERFRGLAGSVAYSYFVKLDQVTGSSSKFTIVSSMEKEFLTSARLSSWILLELGPSAGCLLLEVLQLQHSKLGFPMVGISELLIVV